MNKVLRLRYHPDSALRVKCTSLTEEEKLDVDLPIVARRMSEILDSHKGYGLSAPQVGLDKRLFVMRDTGVEWPKQAKIPKTNAVIILNPRIINGLGTNYDWEGCLSVPGQRAKISRPETLVFSFEVPGSNGVFIRHPTGLACRCVCHEIDHLDGIMFFDRIEGLRRKMLLQKYAKKKHLYIRD